MISQIETGGWRKVKEQGGGGSNQYRVIQFDCIPFLRTSLDIATAAVTTTRQRN